MTVNLAAVNRWFDVGNELSKRKFFYTSLRKQITAAFITKLNF